MIIEVWCTACEAFIGEYPEEEIHQEVECPECGEPVEVA
jgi:predicted RNA-binding Zn-ribbon protein involved in translation (DUF1610 family)